MIYLDSSALLKLVVEERESAALETWLREQDQHAVSSGLALVEVERYAARVGPPAVAGARRLLRGIDLLPLDRAVLDEAARLLPTALRSLDAIHLASAQLLGADLKAFVAYDLRLVAASAAAGLPVRTPGVSPPT